MAFVGLLLAAGMDAQWIDAVREADLSGLPRHVQNTILRFTCWYAPASRVSRVNRVYEFIAGLPSDVRDNILAYTNNALSLKYRPAPTFTTFFMTYFGYLPWVAVSYVFSEEVL